MMADGEMDVKRTLTFAPGGAGRGGRPPVARLSIERAQRGRDYRASGSMEQTVRLRPASGWPAQ